MAEDVEGGTSAIAFWAAAYGNDGDARLTVEFSTDSGSSWTELGSFTVTKGSLQHIILDIPLEGNARFRIVQGSGTRVNIDDITIYGRDDEPQPALKGDVNGDGEVNIADINLLANIILGFDAGGSTMIRADVNEDGEINIADVNAVIAIILN